VLRRKITSDSQLIDTLTCHICYLTLGDICTHSYFNSYFASTGKAVS